MALLTEVSFFSALLLWPAWAAAPDSALSPSEVASPAADLPPLDAWIALEHTRARWEALHEWEQAHPNIVRWSNKGMPLPLFREVLVS